MFTTMSECLLPFAHFELIKAARSSGRAAGLCIEADLNPSKTSARPVFKAANLIFQAVLQIDYQFFQIFHFQFMLTTASIRCGQ